MTDQSKQIESYPRINCEGDRFWENADYQYHRVGGPAIEWHNGDQNWYFNGQLHRLDGPAFIWEGHAPEWHYLGKKIACSSQEEFEKMLKLKAFW
jgi:hypothetical protein